MDCAGRATIRSIEGRYVCLRSPRSHDLLFGGVRPHSRVKVDLNSKKH